MLNASSYSMPPFSSGHHYLILRKYFIPFSPSDVVNASQPCQIQVTTFIFTVVSRDRHKEIIFIYRDCAEVYHGGTGKKSAS